MNAVTELLERARLAQQSRKFWMRRAREVNSEVDDCEPFETFIGHAYTCHHEVMRCKRLARDLGGRP